MKSEIGFKKRSLENCLSITVRGKRGDLKKALTEERRKASQKGAGKEIVQPAFFSAGNAEGVSTRGRFRGNKKTGERSKRGRGDKWGI